MNHGSLPFFRKRTLCKAGFQRFLNLAIIHKNPTFPEFV